MVACFGTICVFGVGVLGSLFSIALWWVFSYCVNSVVGVRVFVWVFKWLI